MFNYLIISFHCFISIVNFTFYTLYIILKAPYFQLLSSCRSVDPSAFLYVFLMCESLTFSYLRDRHYALHLFIFSVGPHSYAFLVYGSISPNFRVLSVSELITLLASSPAFWCIDISKTSQGQTFGSPQLHDYNWLSLRHYGVRAAGLVDLRDVHRAYGVWFESCSFVNFKWLFLHFCFCHPFFAPLLLFYRFSYSLLFLFFFINITLPFQPITHTYRLTIHFTSWVHRRTESYGQITTVLLSI